jgi:hypothetical protein
MFDISLSLEESNKGPKLQVNCVVMLTEKGNQKGQSQSVITSLSVAVESRWHPLKAWAPFA